MLICHTPGPVPKGPKLLRSEKWLDVIRGMSCRRCFKPNESTAAHIRVNHYRGGAKPGDNRTLPLCWNPCHHREEHMDTLTFWREVGIDNPITLAESAHAHWVENEDRIAAEDIIFGRIEI